MNDSADGVTIRDLETLEEYLACCDLQEETWGKGFSERVPAAILRVSQKIGGVTAGAFAPDGTMVGFVFGMTGLRDGKPAHWSDMLAVREHARGRHLGDRLKLFQRDRVRALGCEVMLWTYDPLVARNAHFNINRLGALPVEYVTDMYGSNTGSELHGKLPTDRFVIEWNLVRPFAPIPGADAPHAGDDSIPLGNPLGVAALPVLELPSDGTAVRVQIPRDLAALQRASKDDAMHWRLTVRDALVGLYAKGLKVSRFVRATGDGLPYYVVTRCEA
jgi:chorismate synthase